MSRSADAGVTWTTPAALNTNAETDSGWDAESQVTTDGGGNWVAVWWSIDSLGGTIGDDTDILVSRSADAGITWTAPAALNTNAGTDSRQDGKPQVTTDGAGNWVAVWDSLDGWDYDIFVSRSTDAGVTWTTPAALNTNAETDSGNDKLPQVTTDGAGNWVAVWQSADYPGGTVGWDILVSRSDNDGLNWTAPEPLNTNAGTDPGWWDDEPQVTTDGAGNWVAVWVSDDTLGGTIGTDMDILFATFSEILWDFGDAPAAAQSGFAGSYPTTLTDDGARHTVAGPTLGVYRDSEADGQLSANADGDDTAGTPDDEDGVTIPVLSASTFSSTTASLTVDLQNADATANYLDAWIDFNQDGDWNDPGEQVFTVYNLGTTNGVKTLSFTIPQDTGDNIVYGTTYARFRLSTAGGLPPTGAADDGEVEDYRLTINASKPVQIIYSNQTVVPAPAGNSFQFNVFYDVSNGDNTLTGLVLRMHYDSMMLSYDGVTNLLEIPSGNPTIQVLPDQQDYDQDPATDYYVNILWTDFTGMWPDVSLPTRLLMANFTFATGLAVGAATPINFTGVPAITHTLQTTPVVARVASPFNLDVDLDGVASPLSDGILLVRRMAGFEGAILTDGAAKSRGRQDRRGRNCPVHRRRHRRGAIGHRS